MRIIIMFLFLFSFLQSFSQTGQSRNFNPISLRDSNTNYLYVLDSLHTSITAFNSCGEIIWTIKPNLDFKCESSTFPKYIDSIGFHAYKHDLKGEDIKEKIIWLKIYK